MTEWTPMFPGVRRRIRADGEKIMVVEVEFEAGAGVPMHQHPHEQVSYMVSGRGRFTLDGRAFDVLPGQLVHIPSNLLHQFEAVEASIVMDTFSPPREDFRKA